jgi:hypothetical protein
MARRGEFFSCSVLTSYHHGYIGFGRPFDEGADVADFGVRAQDALGGESFLDFFAKVKVFLDQFLLPAFKIAETLGVF